MIGRLLGWVDGDSETKKILEHMEDNMLRSGSSDVDLSGLMGAPSPFSQLADIRSNKNPYGSTYLNKFISEGNFVAFTMGRPKMMVDDEGEKLELMKNMVDGAGNEEDAEKLADLLDKTKKSKLYGFKHAMSEYWRYVNILCTVSAKLLNIDKAAKDIGGQGFFGDKFSDYKWEKFKSAFINEQMSTEAGDDETEKTAMWDYVPFYNDGVIETSESLSNTTGPPSIKSTVQNLQNTIPGTQAAKEMAFLDGRQISKDVQKFSKDSSIESMDTGKGLKSLLTNGASMLNANMGMPDIWKDSNYDKPYNLKFKFSTPHGDPLSIYLNVIVPICHLLPMVSARQVAAGNMYTSAFIMRVYCKGMVNCNLGIATNVVIERNQRNVSVDGLPTEVNVTLTIKDLFPMLAMPDSPTINGVLKTTGLMGYLGTLCGFNMQKPDLKTLVEMKTIMSWEKYVNPLIWGQALRRKTSDFTQNLADDLLEKFNLRP